MSSCRFSIVIPTRDREDTLGFTLQTCLAQQFDDFEIVVSDNSTTDATRGLVEQIASPKIKYVRPPRPLAMSDNWDFGVDHASGEFITVVGSDDGLMLHTLPELDRIIRMLDAKILHWEPATYNWPDLPAQDFAAANDLLIPMKQVNWCVPVRCMDSRCMIQAAANSEVPYAALPMIYCSVVHRDLIELLRQKTGRVFRSASPDIYSSFAFAHIAGTYYSLGAPMSINGLSGGSNGVAHVYLKDGKAPAVEDFWTLNAQGRHRLLPWIPDLMAMPVWAADSFGHAKESLFPDDDGLFCDRRRLITNALRELRASDEGEWQAALQAIRVTLVGDVGLQQWFEAEYGQMSHADFTPAPHHKLKRYGQTHLHLNAAEFGVTNIMEAAQLCEKILGFKRDGVNAHVVSAEESTDSIVQNRRELEQKEAVIQGLALACKERLEIIEKLTRVIEAQRIREAELTGKMERQRAGA